MLVTWDSDGTTTSVNRPSHTLPRLGRGGIVYACLGRATPTLAECPLTKSLLLSSLPGSPGTVNWYDPRHPPTGGRGAQARLMRRGGEGATAERSPPSRWRPTIAYQEAAGPIVT